MSELIKRKGNPVLGSVEYTVLEDISFSQFDEFLDSLTVENDTWNLDKQSAPTREVFYNGHKHCAIIALDGEEVVALCSFVVDMDFMSDHPAFTGNPTNVLNNFFLAPQGMSKPSVDVQMMGILYSYVVKKSHWRKGIGKKLLGVTMSTFMKGQSTLDYQCNRMVHMARTHLYNKGSRGMLESLQFHEVNRDDKQIIYAYVLDTSGGNPESYKHMVPLDEEKTEEKPMKIQFIITGWHYNQPEYYDGLHELEKDNDNIKVFWSCHKEPPKQIKDKFKWKLFFNGGEESGCYDQALNYLNLDDETICFFMHDDLIIKKWDFVPLCLRYMNNYKIIGNCRDYSDVLDPFEVTDIGISEEFDGKTFKDYVKPENQHLFTEKMSIMRVRLSFMCTKYKYIKEIGGFEPREEAYVPPLTVKDEWSDTGQSHYRGGAGLSSFGNIFPALVMYKINKVLGSNSIAYLSDRYLDSDYIYELGRGEIDPNNPIT